MDTIKLILDWYPNTNHTGFYVALKKGYFEEEKLLIQNSMLEKIAEGIQLTGIATITQKCDSGIISLKEADIRSPKILEGKRLTHWNSQWFHSVVREVMRLDGGKLTSYQRMQEILPLH